MRFSPANAIVRLCLQGMAMEESQPQAALNVFLQAWNEAGDDYERFLAAFFVARRQENHSEQLQWYETALQLALKEKDPGITPALPVLYEALARCHETAHQAEQAKRFRTLAAGVSETPDEAGPFYHGTRAELHPGDLLTPGRESNYQAGLVMNHIYFTAVAEGAGLAAALAKGEGRERVYLVEPMGAFEHDPNVTNKKFPGNPTRSYRTAAPLRVLTEITDWAKQTEEDLQRWREKLDKNQGEIIN